MAMGRGKARGRGRSIRVQARFEAGSEGTYSASFSSTQLLCSSP